MFGNILTHQENPFIPQHLLAQRLADRLLKGHLCGWYVCRHLND
jgi:hypothetical protein